MKIKIDGSELLKHLSYWHNKTDDECIALATNENGLDVEQALSNIVERDLAVEFNKEVVKGLQEMIK